MSDPVAEQELVARARSGDDRAFREIVDRYEGVVAGVVIGMLGPGPDAEDVGQETFIRLYRSLARFRGDATLKTYVTRIAINLSLNARKRRRRDEGRRADGSGRSPGDPGPLASARAPEEVDAEVEARERRRLIDAAHDTLDAKHRAVVVLRMLEGHSTAETAEALGVPPGTVMSRLTRALSKLRPRLEALRPTDG